MRTERRKGIEIMMRLIGLVKPMLPIMIIAIILGILGYMCAISITVMAGFVFISKVSSLNYSVDRIFVLLIFMAVMRGVLHYGEQYCNHFIAFKLLAYIRKKVFAQLRKLCPAKLEGRDKGNLISVITTDIELLEVFYAHTISPILIGISVSIIMFIFIAHQSIYAGLLSASAYIVVGALIPLIMGRLGGGSGMQSRENIGRMNSFVLESLRGLDEIIQYGQQSKRLKEIETKSIDLGSYQKQLNSLEAIQRSLTNLAVFAASVGMLFLMLQQYRSGNANYDEMLLSVVAMISSFGPVIALSNLSNNLNHTLASGERVLNLLEEKPLVDEVKEGEDVDFENAEVKNVDFSYDNEKILTDMSIKIEKGRMTIIHGVSGSGKSTLLKLLMRFWDVDSGEIAVSGKDIRKINTSSLRKCQAYVTQDTYLFHDSIASNIAISNPDATLEEIEKAARKASLHDFIASLPEGYETKLGELGDTISGGEKQRIGLARAFLHDAQLLLLDEPTSNLDSLNEGIILKSLTEGAEDKTIVMVTHRESSKSRGDVIIEMDNSRKS
mgnify:FL=1